MTFLNWPILFAMSAVAVPIAIHLLNRRSAKVVPWGAMHFLMGSLVSRKRRVLLEEVLLLALRCLLVALLVMAVARPVVVSGSIFSSIGILLAVLVGVVALGAGAAAGQFRALRRRLYGAGAGFLALALAAIVVEYVFLGGLVGGARDVALVIDGSASMGLERDGRSNFARAVEEARDLAKSLGRSSTVSVVLAGPVPEVRTPFPLTDPDRIAAVLDELQPTGGTFAVHEALLAASASLAATSNVAKQIVVFTDGQGIGWDVDDRARWGITAAELKAAHVAEPRLACRVLEMSDKVRNLAVTDVAGTRQVVGTDRPLPIQVRVANTGGAAVAASSAYLSVDGKQVDQRPITQLEPGASETLTFSHRFAAPGFHALEVRADADDDLPGDNRRVYVARVLERLPILVVDGHAARRLLDRASAFIRLALDPGGVEAAGGKGTRGFVEVTVVEAPQLGAVPDLGKFRAVVLADVPQLPKGVAARLADYVAEGGGLLIAPGERALPAFYNGWAAPGPTPRPLLPAVLGRRAIADEKDPARLAVDTLTHPALTSFIEAGKGDLGSALFGATWTLAVDPKARAVQVGGRLADGSPWLVEQPVGLGRVLLLAVALDIREGNLPTRRSFLPLLHGLVYHLADASPSDLNQRPSRQLVLRLDADASPPVPPGQPPPASSQATGPAAVEVVAPDGTLRGGVGQLDRKALVLKVDGASLPGVYQAKLPPALAVRGERTIPFAVTADPAESNLKRLTDAELDTLRTVVKLDRLKTRDDLLAIAAGRPPGRALGKYLALLALLVAAGEVALTRWIALRRTATAARTIDFTATAAAPTPAYAEALAAMQDRQEGGGPADEAGEGRRDLYDLLQE